jgi:hypothetical protein
MVRANQRMESEMAGTNGVYKKAASRKKTAPVRRIVVSPDAQKAYEKVVEEREAKHREYGRHLSADNKPR